MIGFSLFAIALGAILKFAVTADPAGIDLSTVGLILMVVGAIGLVVGVTLYLSDRPDGSWLNRHRGSSP
jgi:Flp pilus assembly protein protease CpaA